MDDNFKLRVDKVFGSLLQSQPISSDFSRPSPWTVSDEEVERRKWRLEENRLDREDLPCAASFNEFFSDEKAKEPKDLGKELEQDLDDLDDEGQGFGGGLQDAEKEENEIRNSIGLDATLDNEDEEDEFDKVASGREDAGDRLYMRDVNKPRSYLNSFDVICDDLFADNKSLGRDPRADHLAARARLREDQKITDTFDMPDSHDRKIPDVVDFQDKVTEDGGNVKSILKRKEAQMESKPKKRVRFDPECKERDLEDNHDLSKFNESMEPATVAEMNDMPEVAHEVPDYDQHGSYVPDYLRNPQNYTCYTLDSTDEADDESNKQAYRDLCSMMKKSSSSLSASVSLVGLPTSITFTPRKKVVDPAPANNSPGMDDSLSRVMCPLGIAVTEQQQNEACAMDEDDVETSILNRSSQKLSRQYRSKDYSAD
ncbi:uncharacterized protein [Aristolochia californica]|uniref:uncharacterized protein n=1 Tax=Aristolochia californica TaxID=171875 RepID=UPI0035D587BB